MPVTTWREKNISQLTINLHNTKNADAIQYIDDMASKHNSKRATEAKRLMLLGLQVERGARDLTDVSEDFDTLVSEIAALINVYMHTH